jgi:phosphoribosylglycinamide formyltransferase 1
MKKIVILTGSELRHTFFREYVALVPGIEVLASFCEGTEKSYKAFVEKQTEPTDLRGKHLIAREQSEIDSFDLFVKATEDKSNPFFLPKGQINDPAYIEKVIELKPDLLLAFGCSIIKGKLLDEFKGHFLNAHLGLSPYYRGSGTNYWPLVNGEPEFVGVTFMYIDPGIDTGEIIHQIRARIFWGDTPSSIGNRLIRDMAHVYSKLVLKFESLVRMIQPKTYEGEKVYKQSNYSEDSVEKIYKLFNDGLVEKYINEEEERVRKAPIIVNPALDRYE